MVLGRSIPPLDGTFPITELGQLDDRLQGTVEVAEGGATAWIVLEIPQAGFVDIDVVARGDGEPVITLFDNSGREFASTGDNFSDLSSRIGRWLNRGTYLLAVDEVSDASMAAEVAVRWLPPLEVFDPITDLGQLDGQLQSTVEVVADGAVVWIAFEVLQSELIDIDVVAISDSDPVIGLFEASGRQVAFDDDSGLNFNARIEKNLGPGHYFLAIYEFAGAAMTADVTVQSSQEGQNP